MMVEHSVWLAGLKKGPSFSTTTKRPDRNWWHIDWLGVCLFVYECVSRCPNSPEGIESEPEFRQIIWWLITEIKLSSQKKTW